MPKQKASDGNLKLAFSPRPPVKTKVSYGHFNPRSDREGLTTIGLLIMKSWNDICFSMQEFHRSIR